MESVVVGDESDAAEEEDGLVDGVEDCGCVVGDPDAVVESDVLVSDPALVPPVLLSTGVSDALDAGLPDGLDGVLEDATSSDVDELVITGVGLAVELALLLAVTEDADADVAEEGFTEASEVDSGFTDEMNVVVGVVSTVLGDESDVELGEVWLTEELSVVPGEVTSFEVPE